MGKRVLPPSFSLPALDDISVRPALSREELEHAYRRVYWSFRERGYIEECPSETRVSIFNAFPTTVTFVCVLRGIVIASGTIVEDTEIGLPMDEIYHDELQGLRDAGRTLTEVTMLADRRRDVRRTLPMLLFLMKHIFDYVTLIVRADDMCITINPRHETFFQEYLLFKPLGPLRAYPSVKNHPALAKRLVLDTVMEECRTNEERWEQFFENRTPVNLLKKRYRMTCEDLRYFFIELTSIFRDASPETLDCLRKHYAECPWDEWKVI